MADPGVEAGVGSEETSSGRHLPALDGLRGVAVLAVLAYHLWPQVVPGGFLGVTVFFVLSGFLITRLLLAEHATTETIDLRQFWRRRGRRLLPASLMTLAVVSVAWMMQGWLTRAFSADILWSLADLANWHTLASGASYGAAGIDSPVLHFWSLAIEEQCYLVLPLVVWVVLRWRGWSTRVLGRIVAVLLLASLAYTAANRGDANLVYLSTFSRVAELLAGVLLAVFVAHRGMPTGPAWRVIGPIAAVILFVAAFATSLDNPVYAVGGLFVAALLAVGVLIASSGDAATTGPSRLTQALSVGPIRYVGRISYGVYLFHWPILMAFREANVDDWYVTPATLLLTFALAALSMVLIEAPIRTHRRVTSAPRDLILALAATIVVVCVWGVAPPAADLDFATAQSQFDGLGATDPGQPGAGDDAAPFTPGDPTQMLPAVLPTAPSGGPPAPTEARPPTVMVFGDSTALMLGLGLMYSDVAVEVPGFANVGCPVTRGGSFRLNFGDDHAGKVFASGKPCDWSKKLPALAAKSHPQIALFSGGMIDTVPRKISALGSGWHTIDEPAFQDLMRSEYEAAVDAVHGASPDTRVVLLTLSPDWKRGNDTHRARIDIIDRLLDEVAADRPDVVQVVDLKSWIDATGERERLCPDGLHLVPNTTAKEVYEQFLGPRLQQIASGAPTARH